MISATSGSVFSKESSRSCDLLVDSRRTGALSTHVLVGFGEGIAVCCHCCEAVANWREFEVQRGNIWKGRLIWGGKWRWKADEPAQPKSRRDFSKCRAPRWSDPNLWALEAVTALFCRFPSTGFELAYQEIVGRKNQSS